MGHGSTFGDIIKYGTEGCTGRDLTGSQELVGRKCWASKLFQVIRMGPEAIRLKSCTII